MTAGRHGCFVCTTREHGPSRQAVNTVSKMTPVLDSLCSRSVNTDSVYRALPLVVRVQQSVGWCVCASGE